MSEVQSLTARTTGRELKKREIQLLDQSGATVSELKTFEKFS